MPRLVHRLPAYKLHRASGKARVRHQNREIFLPGKFGSKESREAYGRFLAEMSSQPDSTLVAEAPAPDLLSISELILRYLEHAARYYKKDGRPTGEHRSIMYAVRPLEAMFGLTLARDCGPKSLKLVRAEMVRLGWSRRHINRSVSRIKRMFSWASEEEIVPGEVALNLKTVAGLKMGRSEARERPPVGPVPDEHIEATLPFLSPCVRDLVILMRLSAMRPCEALSLTVEVIEQSDPGCWCYCIAHHKTSHYERERVVYLGPKCQVILLPRIMAAGTGRLFGISYRGAHNALARACLKAGVPRFGLNQLRHSRATEIRQKFGLEAAQVALGHSNAKTTEIYACRDMNKARDVARRIG